ncbi:MAG TPA: replicative DNA helicase [Candidatus Monoglobus merdigallinarum]|uniref:Replicative DNA helicase n=1 Tax=Candidatus Monoglobus merdigallinarum TaxID=2838698 RepID=A0A9D1PRY7_9FIRM|nr:replicative DNA helicase [Candidatus Monoglobus merdigallinarum]
MSELDEITGGSAEPYNDPAAEFRTMPFSNEAEQAVVASIIINREIIPDVVGIISASDFYIDRHRELFETVVELFNRGVEINYVSLKEALEKRGSLESVGGLEFVFRLMDLVPATDRSSVTHYSEIVREKSELRRLIAMSEKISKRCYTAEDDVDDIISDAEQEIINVTKNRNATGLTHISVFLNESVSKIEQLADAKEAVTGLTTGFADIDRRTAGLHPAEFILIAARPGMGKTSLALNIAQNAAIIDNATVAIFSLEMPGIQIANRMLSSQASVSAERIKRGDLKEDDWPELGEALAALVGTNIYIDDDSSITARELSAKCKKLKLEKGLDLVIVDYLQLMSSGTKAGNRQQEVSDISRMLKIMANDLQIPVIALSQLNRSVEKREVKEPVLSDLRESGSIEQDADMVLFLYREGYYNEDCEEPNKTKLKFEKHRNGEVGYEFLSWLGEYTKFANWSGIRE